ncbi:MAG: type III-A CRISPR-associated protein Csm2 [Desulfobaccales bacterium]|jgi:CRISPR-associated protein Csm2
MSPDVTQISLWADREKGVLNPLIFSKSARELSRTLAAQKGNKRTQIRKFYDEVLRLDQAAKKENPERWPNVLAQLHLLIPKAAYAQGRDLVSPEFVRFIQNSVEQVKLPQDLSVFANLFEAFMGFYKLDRPKD